MNRPAPAVGLALGYAAYFTVLGVLVPFWPVWLHARGMGGSEIGLLVAAGVWIRVVGGPLAGHVADLLGRRRRPIVVLAWSACLVFTLYPLCGGFWSLMAVSLAFGIATTSVLPLADSLTMLVVAGRGGSYGRVRLWGSLAFLAAAALAGLALERLPPDAVWAIALGLLCGHAAVSMLLPEVRTPPSPGGGMPLRRLLRVRGLVAVVAGASLVQGGHAMYYGFSTLHWQASGIPSGTIGMLWAIGVVAEIALFSWRGLVVRLGAGGLLLLGGLGGAVRWSLTAATTDVGALVVLQTLHALTFGATHLGAVAYVARALPAELSASGQALYSGVGSGLVLGLALAAAGPLYEAMAGRAYLVMAAMSVAGLLVVARGLARGRRLEWPWRRR